MPIAEASVRRPVTVLVAVLAVSLFGFLAAGRLPVELLPDISYPTITVQTDIPDAAPESVEQFVTRPIEEAVGVVSGLREMRSVSRPGRSEVILELEWDEEIELAALDVREKLGTVQLPREAEVPRVLRFDPSLEPIVRLALVGDRPLDDLRQLADRWLKRRLEAVDGVAAAKVRGGLDPEVVVEADEDRLAALGLTLDDLAAALRGANVDQPGGTLRDFNAVYLVRTLHEFTDLDQLRRTIVRDASGGRIRIEDVAAVRRGHKEREEISRLGGREVVELSLHREGSANTVEAAGAIRAEIEELRTDLPADLELEILADQSVYIAAAVDEVATAAWLGGLIAIVVLWFFLRDVASTTIIALAIPVSVLATFLGMQQAAVSLNIMSLGGLALGVGMLVDNSIVVLEAIARHREEQGSSRSIAAGRGATEVAAAVAASTLTTICVFLPIVFVEGIAGQLFRDQALTVCLSLLASLFVSLTVIPALAALDARIPGTGEALPREDEPPWTFRLGSYRLYPIGDGRSLPSRAATVLLFPVRLVLLLALAAVLLLGSVVGRVLTVSLAPLAAATDGLRRVYPRALGAALDRRRLVLLVAVTLFAVSAWVLPRLGTQLVPDLAQGQFAFQLRLPEGTPLATTADTVARIESHLVGDPRFGRVFSVVGSLPSTASGRRTLGENLAQIDLVVAPEVDQEEAEAAVRRVLARFQRVRAELAQPAVLSLAPPVAVRLFGDDLEALDEAADRTAEVLRGLARVTDVGTTSEPGNPEVRIDIDRERAASLGLDVETVARSLQHKIGGDVVGEFREGEERIDIRLRAGESFRDQAGEIGDLRLRLEGGVSVPVSALARVEPARGPAAIHRIDGARLAEVTARGAAGADLASVLGDVHGALGDLELPAAVRAELAGQDEDLEVSMRSLRLALALAVFLVYVVMAAQFESLVHPFVIMASVPLALVGVVAALLLTGDPVSVLVLIGAVMLAGIVVNNAIVLVDAVNRRRREGQDRREAIVDAGSERFRPILMTTATTVLALLPMALGLGAGDELRAPLAVTVIGGLTVATLLTLLVVPCFYRVLDTGALRGAPEDEPGT